MDTVEVQDVKVALQVWGGCGGSRRWDADKFLSSLRRIHATRFNPTEKMPPHPAACGQKPNVPQPDLVGSKQGKSSSKGAPKPAPKAPNLKQHRKETKTLGPAERGEPKSVPEDEERDKSPPHSEKLAEQPSEQPVEEDRPGGAQSLPVLPLQTAVPPPLPRSGGGGGEESCPASQGARGGAPQRFARPTARPAPASQEASGRGEESHPASPDARGGGACHRFSRPPPVPPPPRKAPTEEPVPPPPPKKMAEEDGADDSDEDPLDLENGSDDDNVELSTVHGLPLEDVKAMMGSSGKLKKKRGYNVFKAKIWRQTAELNEGQGNHQGQPVDAWTEEELMALKADFIAFDEQHESGKRVTKRAAAQDVTFTCDKIFEEPLLQFRHRPVRSRGPQDVHNSTSADVPALGIIDKAVKPKGQRKRAQVAEMIRSGLNEMFGTTTVPVEYKNMHEKIEAGMGVRFFGWVENMPWVATSNLGTGGEDTINTMWDRLKAGTAGWRHCGGRAPPSLARVPRAGEELQDVEEQAGRGEGKEVKTSLWQLARARLLVGAGSGSRRRWWTQQTRKWWRGWMWWKRRPRKRPRKQWMRWKGKWWMWWKSSRRRRQRQRRCPGWGEGECEGSEAKAKGKAKAKETEKAKEKEKEKEKERKCKRKAALDNDEEESEDSKSKKVKRAPFRHLTSSTPPPRPQPKPAFKNAGQGKTIVPVDNKQWYIRRRKTEQHARDERARLGSVEYEAKQARKAAKWMAAANTGTAGPSKPPKPSKTLTEVEGEDTDEFDGGGGVRL
ncbi:hypothetical protein B0H14DRAFT_2646939 [Mycena olivaceomarginata]|nr:hypothetical protein B0H14DRAFT_2646939 [Mycena olivaceomarginata]